MSKRDYYEILGLAKNSSEDDIKKSYRKLAMKFHPDRNSKEDSAAAEEKFKEVKEAYETLSNPEKRTEYDTYGHLGPPNHVSSQQWTHRSPGSTGPFEEMFKTFFSQRNFDQDGSFGQQTRQQSIHVITISLADAYVGKLIKVDSKTTIMVPQGFRSGTKFYSDGKIYRVDIQQHYKFKRSNDDLLIDIIINAIEAMMGMDAVLDHLDSAKLQFAIPPGIQQGQILKLGGKGMKNPETDRFGDILVRISITIPKDLTDVQRAALKTLNYRESINI